MSSNNVQICSFFSETLERLLFKYLPRSLERQVGPGATTALVFNIVKEAVKNSTGEILEDVLKDKSLKSALLSCYMPYKEIGKPFDYDLVSERPLTVRVRKCPHYEFTKDYPLACVACAATKAGIIERWTGKKVMLELEDGKKLGSRDARIVIKRTSHMPSGGEYCEFVVKEKE